MAEHVEMEPGLWEEFHRLVNMSSRELLEWLRTRSATEGSEELPDQAGTHTGRKVLRILQKRRADADAGDVEVMREVVDRIHAERRDELEPAVGQQSWRHRLMTLGHDPLKQTR